MPYANAASQGPRRARLASLDEAVRVERVVGVEDEHVLAARVLEPRGCGRRPGPGCARARSASTGSHGWSASARRTASSDPSVEASSTTTSSRASWSLAATLADGLADHVRVVVDRQQHAHARRAAGSGADALHADPGAMSPVAPASSRCELAVGERISCFSAIAHVSRSRCAPSPAARARVPDAAVASADAHRLDAVRAGSCRCQRGSPASRASTSTWIRGRSAARLGACRTPSRRMLAPADSSSSSRARSTAGTLLGGGAHEVLAPARAGRCRASAR